MVFEVELLRPSFPPRSRTGRVVVSTDFVESSTVATDLPPYLVADLAVRGQGFSFPVLTPAVAQPMGQAQQPAVDEKSVRRAGRRCQRQCPLWAQPARAGVETEGGLSPA